MIKQAAYGVEPWSLRESGLNIDLLAQSESVFALSNGHIGLRPLLKRVNKKNFHLTKIC